MYRKAAGFNSIYSKFIKKLKRLVLNWLLSFFSSDLVTNVLQFYKKNRIIIKNKNNDKK